MLSKELSKTPLWAIHADSSNRGTRTLRRVKRSPRSNRTTGETKRESRIGSNKRNLPTEKCHNIWAKVTQSSFERTITKLFNKKWHLLKSTASFSPKCPNKAHYLSILVFTSKIAPNVLIFLVKDLTLIR